MRKMSTVFVILMIRPAPPVSFRVGCGMHGPAHGRLHDSHWEDMASARIPVRRLSNPDIKLRDYACQIRQEVTHCPNPPAGVQESPTSNSHKLTIIWQLRIPRFLGRGQAKSQVAAEACGGGRGGRMESDRRLCNLDQGPCDVATWT